MQEYLQNRIWIILIRADGAGATKTRLTHLRGLRDNHGLDVEFPVAFTMTDPVKTAISAPPKTAWTTAIDADG